LFHVHREEPAGARLVGLGNAIPKLRLREPALAGNRTAGIGLLRQGLADWQATGAVSHRPIHLAMLGEALARDGQVAAGLAALDEALALAARTGERFLEAELHRLRGEALLDGAAGDPSAREAADGCFRRALEVAHRQAARGLALRAAVSRARRDLDRSQSGEAVRTLADVLGAFDEGFDTRDLAEARAVLDEHYARERRAVQPRSP